MVKSKKDKKNPKKKKLSISRKTNKKSVKARSVFVSKRKRVVIKKAKIKKIFKKNINRKFQKLNFKKTKLLKKKINKKKQTPKISKEKNKQLIKKIVKEKNKNKIFVEKENKKQKLIKKPQSQQVPSIPSESLFKAKIKVIGVGGGGGSIVSDIEKSLEKATFVVADTDIRALKKRSGIKYFWFGENLTHGLGTGVNIDLAKKAAESAKEKISNFFQDQDIIIFVASLGGGLGSGATQVFVEAAKEFGGITFGIFTMPFKFEGKNKYRIAQNALKSLKESLNVSLVIPNEKIFKIIDESTPITTAFSTVNKSLINSLESLIDLIYNPGIINIDFADLRTILKGRGNSAFLNTIEESGKDRVEKICENIFKNPLLQNNNLKAEKILFNIVGSENLSMFEVEKISSHISNLNPKAKIIFGISKDTKLKNKIKTTILMTGGQTADDNIIEKTESTKIIKPEKNKELAKKATLVVKKENKQLINVKSKKITIKDSNKKIINKKENLPEIEKKEETILKVPLLEITDKENQTNNSIFNNKKIDIIETETKNHFSSNKKTIRRSGLEIKKAEELQEKKRIAQEKEWEIPAFLRKVKIKN